jgi:hypothetical protein
VVVDTNLEEKGGLKRKRKGGYEKERIKKKFSTGRGLTKEGG